MWLAASWWPISPSKKASSSAGSIGVETGWEPGPATPVCAAQVAGATKVAGAATAAPGLPSSVPANNTTNNNHETLCILHLLIKGLPKASDFLALISLRQIFLPPIKYTSHLCQM